MFLAFSIALGATAQQAASLSPHDASVKRRADGLKPQSRISVVLTGGGEEFGTFLSDDAVGISFFDVDRKAQVTLRYDEIRKIKSGYGGYNSVQAHHTDHTKAIVVTVVVIGVLGAVIGAAAAAKN